ncbi:MAG: SDR family NAD(P)-dependent oxidoreductase, partial [Flavobacteriaceae bacterium]|nr:SDR family NAD(P)-dependent oxidoreductase [Flavobacteriaceae bacterium]
MDLKLQEKIILVTGGSKGIGHAISHVLAADGAIPFIVSRDEKSILQTKEEIEKKGGKCAFAIAELTDPEQCKRAVEKAISLYGTLHGLVNNAGVNDGVGLKNGNAEDFVLSLKKNVVHYYVM